MDISPYGPPPPRSSSYGSCSSSDTPQHKRMRDDDYTQYLDAQPVKCMMTTPTASPSHAGAHAAGTPGGMMCSTPIAGFPLGNAAACSIGLRWGITQKIGPRSNQEDRTVGKVDERYFPHAYFGVFDGHGGSEASEFCADHLHDNVLASEHFPNIQPSLQDGFLRTDADLLRHAAKTTDEGRRRHHFDAGTAAVVMIVTGQELALAHAGDCRALLVKRSGSPVGFVELTHDHTAENKKLANGCMVPHRPDEMQRVQRAGGTADEGGYVCVGENTLPMTRALGDLPLKCGAHTTWEEASVDQQVVTALPDVGTYARGDDDLCVVLASDGLFGVGKSTVMSCQQVADVARGQLEGAGGLGAEMRTARSLADLALTKHQSTDNVSVVVVSLDPPAPPLQPPAQRAAPSLGAAGSGPSGLRHQGSDESMATAGAPSPGRAFGLLGEKLRIRFGDAYPPGKENHTAYGVPL